MSGFPRVTPPVEVQGRFSLRAPFPDVGNRFITVIASRRFDDCEAQGDDVFKDYYEPMGLVTGDYTRDLAAGAFMITLHDAEGNTIYVPDTYIISYPNMGDVRYAHLVMSISLGPVPESLDLSAVGTQVSALVSGTIGVENEVKFHIAPSKDAIPPEQHEALETARQAAITNRVTITADNERLKELLVAKEQTLAVYLDILRRNNLLPE